MHIATIYSMVHPTIKDQLIDEGYYELEVHVNMAEAAATGDPQGFVRKTLAEHLASCVYTTGLPLNERCWQVNFTVFAQTNFNYPEGFVT